MFLMFLVSLLVHFSTRHFTLFQFLALAVLAMRGTRGRTGGTASEIEAPDADFSQLATECATDKALHHLFPQTAYVEDI